MPDQVGMQGRSVTRNGLGRAVQDPRSTRSAGCGEVPPGAGSRPWDDVSHLPGPGRGAAARWRIGRHARGRRRSHLLRAPNLARDLLASRSSRMNSTSCRSCQDLAEARRRRVSYGPSGCSSAPDQRQRPHLGPRQRQDPNRNHRRCPGPGLARGVDLRREFENPCPPLKTLSLRRSRGFYKQDRRSSGPTVVDSRGRMVRSLGMAQTLLRPEQVDDLAAEYRDGATLGELAARFAVNRRTVAAHLVRREVPIRRGSFDRSRIHEAADLYLSGLTLVEVGVKVGAEPQAVRRALASHGIVIRPGGGRRSRVASSLVAVG